MTGNPGANKLTGAVNVLFDDTIDGIQWRQWQDLVKETARLNSTTVKVLTCLREARKWQDCV